MVLDEELLAAVLEGRLPTDVLFCEVAASAADEVLVVLDDELPGMVFGAVDDGDNTTELAVVGGDIAVVGSRGSLDADSERTEDVETLVSELGAGALVVETGPGEYSR